MTAKNESMAYTLRTNLRGIWFAVMVMGWPFLIPVWVILNPEGWVLILVSCLVDMILGFIIEDET